MMEVISTRRYEAGPPNRGHHGILVDPENSVALVKEEEWETRKKKEITTTRQIETRVKRQVVLEDGEVVVDTGPCVTTNMTEDVEQEEHTTQERRTTGDQPQEVEWPISGRSTADGSVVQKELNETVIKSREEIEERLETEDRQQLGDISDEAYQKAIRNNRGDLKAALAESSRQVAPQTGPRVLQHTTKSNKVVDTEKTLERQELKADGLIVTEKRQTVEHEEIKDEEVPDDGTAGEEEATETRKEGTQSFVKKREEDVVDYISGGERIAREMRYVAETTEGERIGDWTPPPNNMRTTRLHKHFGFPSESTPIARKDALTKKPLDLEEEDEARKFETSKWLESHFGSESRSSHGSIEADDSPFPPSTNTSYINVTMKSCAPIERDYQNVETNRHQRIAPPRDSTSPSGYFHGISEWSERKENGHVREQNQFDSNYSRTYDSVRRREHQEPLQDRQCTPSPPVRRKTKDQWSSKTMEKSISKDLHTTRVSSPVQVVQRTWENRGREAHEQQSIDRHSHKRISSRSRSVSPKEEPTVKEERKPVHKEDNVKGSKKGSGQSKSKIGESFRKLMGKLRSTSTERKNKRSIGNNSTSQVTQTEDNGPTYRQYNVVDKCIPLVSEDRAPERPPRSPRITNVINNKPTKISNTSKVAQSTPQDQRWQRDGCNDSTPPIHRYYLGEDPFGGSIYGKEKGYRDSKRSSRTRGSPRDMEYSAMSSSLGRFSKSTSRLVHELDREDQLRNAQTLPRNMRSTGRPPPLVRRQQQQQQQQTHGKIPSRQVMSSGITPSRQYGSMINISIKNTISSPKTYAYQTLQPPPKLDRGIYKSVLARSKSFSIEEDRNDGEPSPRLPFKSSLQLNRLDETPPLKSPGILASISRSNRDLFKESRRE